jgi:hypothetical protein
VGGHVLKRNEANLPADAWTAHGRRGKIKKKISFSCALGILNGFRITTAPTEMPIHSSACPHFLLANALFKLGCSK